ncbi:MAG: MFS transporter [Clostridia bacterium]|nr:MFS transporter [Clostridia bacterium]
MKLNVKRTFLVGLAFLSISAFWGLYDFVVPLILKNTYALGDTWAGTVMAMDNIVALFLLPFFGALSDKCKLRIGRRTPFIIFGTVCAVILLLALPFVVKHGTLPVFLCTLALLLLAMGTYRSPAVALMPDVTPKPLRSKGNAIINLMGAIGGALSLVLVNFAVIRTVDDAGATHSDYTLLFISVAVIMVVCIAVLVSTIRERKLVAEMEAINYGETADAPKAVQAAGKAKLPKDVMRSLILILCSVSLWFMGYNAVTSAFSKYATSVWNVTESAAANCMLVGTVGAIISYWPVGIISSKIGRKRMIQFGILLLAFCFFVGSVLPEMSFIMYVMFALVGVAWASINVNSFPMVVEMASGADTGKYTGYYYTFSMSAQVLTPILSGALLEHVGYHTLFPYAMVMLLGAFVTFFFVKHGDSKPQAKSGLEALDVED